MELNEILKAYPEMKGILIGKINPNEEDLQYLFEGEYFQIIELLPDALNNDPEFEEDQDAIRHAMNDFEWITYPVLTIAGTDNDWDVIKKNIVKKHKFLDALFNKNKLRRSLIARMDQWFTVYSSLLASDTKLGKVWLKEYKKVLPSEKLKAKLLKHDPPIEFLGTPSPYDMFDIEQKKFYVAKISKLLHRILTIYIDNHHPTFKSH